MAILDGGSPTGLPAPTPAVSDTTGRILVLANQQLQDLSTMMPLKKWSYPALLNYLNLLILKIIDLKPDAYATTAKITLAAGAVQAVPSNTFQVIDFLYNLGTADAPGRAITTLDKQKMDHILPGWLTNTPAVPGDIIHTIVDPRNPDVFYVWPPPVASGQKISAVVSTTPAQLTAVDDDFPLDDSYIPACVDGLVALALYEETTIPNALQKAGMFEQKFMQDLGLMASTEKATAAQGQ